MEEQRIGVMYLNLFKNWLGEIWDGMFPRGFRRSNALPILAVSMVILLPIAAWRLHRAGKFGQLKRQIKGVDQQVPIHGPAPGGMEPIVLTRTQTSAGDLPEFRSLTLLPGLGMQVLQLVAYIPGKGEVPLLAAPTIEEVANGNTPMRIGPNDRWGAIEVPWSGVLTGALTPVGTSFRNAWRGRTIETAVNAGRGIAEGGLMNGLAADSTAVTPTSDGQSVVAIFKGADFDQHWPSTTDIVVVATLGSRSIELSVTAKNVGQAAEPIGIGWHPRFLIPSKNRDGAQLQLPSGEQMDEVDRAREIPSGKFSAPSPDISRFQIHPATIGLESFDEALVHLKAGLMDSGISAELRDPESAIGLRMVSLSDTMRELRVTSPAGSGYVGLGMQTNLDDPLGKEWTGPDGQAISVLPPGQSAVWKISLEIFPIANKSAVPR